MAQRIPHSNFTLNQSSISEELHEGSENRVLYGCIMFLILTIGLVGNVFVLVVFLRTKLRQSQVITPYITSLAIADLFIIVFGYPVAVEANLSNEKLQAGSAKCFWSAFINGAVGISSIATFTEISIVMCYTITKTISPQLNRVSCKIQFLTISGVWLYGVCAMLPPALGWSRFVPGYAGISCAPDWSSKSFESISYNIALIFFGFVFPICVISRSYYRIYRSLHLNNMFSGQKTLILRRKKSQIKVIRMIAASIVTFVASWLPYCIVCLIEMIREDQLLTNSSCAEIPELMAKASVIYNPFIYIVMNRDIRKSAKRLVSSFSSSLSYRKSTGNDFSLRRLSQRFSRTL